MRPTHTLFSLFLLILMVFTFQACSSEDTPSNEKTEYPEAPKGNVERTPIVLSEKTRATAEDLKEFYTAFTTDVAKYIDSPDSQSKNGNFVCSPIGVSIILGMASNGLDEKGQKQVLNYLQIKDVSSLNELSRLLLEKIPLADVTVKSRLTNSLWLNTSYNLKFSLDFSNHLESNYFCDCNYADFSSSDFCEKLDKWCETNTEGLFKKFPNYLDASSYSLFVSALYFNAPWRNELFDESKTTKAAFNGQKCRNEVDMMESKIALTSIYENKDFSLFTLLFGNGAFSFNILFPREDMTLSDCSRFLDSFMLEHLKETQREELVKFYLPKFNIVTKIDINKIVNYSGRENFSVPYVITGFTPTTEAPLNFEQATVFSIDEKGAKGAAITSNQVVTLPENDPSYREVTIDRPFFFFINEYSTGACLLSGRITDL